MRDRMIDLVNRALKEQFDFVPLTKATNVSDELLANGVIVLPGKTVYCIVDKGTSFAMVMPTSVDSLPLFVLKDLSKHGYYTSQEEAEKHLK